MTTTQVTLQNAATQALGPRSAEAEELIKSLGPRPADELGAGITGGFAVLSVRGKVWRAKHHGEERPLLREDGEPKSSIEVVILKGAPNLSKIYYEQGYAEGSNSPPDCWSVDGRVPDAASPKRQSQTCAGCPHNAWGSRATPNGKGKACADSKRLAVVPLDDIRNEGLGGPMLLRVPPASLAELKTFADRLNQLNEAPCSIGTRIGFDMKAEYPRLTFKPVRRLEVEEIRTVAELRNSPTVERILATAVENVETAGIDTTHTEEDEDDGFAALATPGTLSPAPAQPSPEQASEARAAEVDAKVEEKPAAPPVDPMEAIRSIMSAEQFAAIQQALHAQKHPPAETEPAQEEPPLVPRVSTPVEKMAETVATEKKAKPKAEPKKDAKANGSAPVTDLDLDKLLDEMLMGSTT